MSEKKELSWSRPIFLSVVIAACCSTLSSAIDNMIMHNIILCPEDKFTAVSFYLIFGSLMAVVCTLFYNWEK